jgi:hypothetical protein
MAMRWRPRTERPDGLGADVVHALLTREHTT